MKKNYLFDNQEFDSQEEIEYYCWLKEAQGLGIVEHYIYHPASFVLSERKSRTITKQLKTKTKEVDQFLLHPHSYTADFKIKFTDKINEFKHKLVIINNISYIDVKGTFVGKYNTSGVTFPLNQKWLYDKYNVFVNKLIPKKHFKDTFVPKVILLGKNGKPLKKWLNYPIIG